MATYGWNLRPGNTHAPKRPCIPSQIACRICDQVFTSTQALIAHIETHMAEGESRQHGINLMTSQGDHSASANHFQFNRLLQASPFSQDDNNLPSKLEQKNPINASTPQVVSSRPMPQPQISLFARNNNTTRSQQIPFAQQTKHRVMEEPLNDVTRPFLQLLEKPFTQKESIYDIKNRSDLAMLDLTLRL